MKNIMLKKLSMAITAGCFGLASVAQAAPLVPFSNGSVADANDVNANFTELETRINTISLTPGPAGPAGPAGSTGLTGSIGLSGPAGATGAAGSTGPAGPTGLTGSAGATGPAGTTGLTGPAGSTGATGSAGPTGPAGADGAGIITQSWAGFGAAGKWSSKTFNVTHSADAYDKETRSFVRASTGATTATVEMTRQRTLLGTVVKHQILTFNIDTVGDVSLDGMETYQTDTTTLVNTKTITPGFVIRHEAMGEGMNWSTASSVTKVYEDLTPTEAGFGIDSRSLLAVEDITVNTVGYTGCQKIMEHRTAVNMGGDRQAITWYCPNDGVVKRIVSSAGDSWSMEFDQSASLLAP